MSEEFKIYTRTGDKGQTSLIGGTRVQKYHPRIEAYGTIDELKSYIGILRDHDISATTADLLIEIQDRLFTIESQLAYDPETKLSRPLPSIDEKDIELLELSIDAMNEQLEPLSSFILPGGHILVSHCHVARCICRRAERIVIRLAELHKVDDLNIKYLNRLSDFLFVLARKLAKDLDAPETPWKPRV
jgi:cob(I)alamin adenosyltransferase